ncbi:TIGR02556 family CRISPR-associated protein [Tepidimicrobium xylanilyticum]|uniref:CRISPR-associated protein, Csh1 family n=1 Tax=Tepidimicrobium xylanilyticum TaxID=1123352 RepID=A0A1H2XDA6_9FIRM|nr:TIGR02556 family CRISPR-associated protein [Tepidimicrobium xylanilyticum]SDW90444.1 CRISPR-associated protein, Csh1 family [Tepidimicrobium xylanilyticum]
MIEAIKKIGEPLAKLNIEEQSNILVETINYEEEDRIIILNLDIDNNSINIDIKPIQENTMRDYYYIGTADGPASPQWMLTGNKPDYIISQSIPSLLRIIEEGDVKNLLRQALDIFYFDYGEQDKTKERYRRVLNVEKFLNLNEMKKYYDDSKRDIKKTVSAVAKALLGYISKEYEVKLTNLKLWALTINGEIIQQKEEYKKLAWQLKEAHFEKAKEGTCSVCGSKTKVSSDTGKLKLTYYITQKKNFASDLRNFDKNLRLCQQCHKELILGEIYTIRKLRASIGKLRFLLIPELLFSDNLSVEVKSFDNALRNANTIIHFEDATNIEREAIIRLRKEDYANQFIFHFLFYMKQQQEFRVLQLIKDVTPGRIYEINLAIFEQNEFGRRWFNWPNSNDRWLITFEQIFHLFPIHQDERFVTEHKRILTLYDAILTRKKIDKNVVIEKLNQLAKAYYYEKTDSYQLSKPTNKDTAMIYGILKGMLLVHYLGKLSVIPGGEGMETNNLIVSENLKKFIKELSYNEQQTSLVLLGKLIYEVGRTQERNKLTSKPILEKINYQGMSLSKIQKLSNEIFEKLKQYKLITDGSSKYFIQNIYSDHKILLDKNIKNWKLSNQENVFYILSGYAIGSRPIDKKEDKGEEFDVE